ncbi:DUF3592 domain-containing protein [Streptomyces sp. NPDC037389]|uniref:DUF3592 domain-containing protein n=1 Tax=Streptomyces sp. NPDC037389 TaxID=3155369 RepID=UPI0033C13519
MRDVFFLALPGLLAAGGIAGMVWAVVRMRRLNAAWRSGVTAEGVCVSAYVVTTSHGHGHGGGPSHSTWHHVYEFTTPEGEVLRFEEAGGPRTVVGGDRVVVRYPEERPGRATAIPPGKRNENLFATGCLLAFLTVFVLGALSFIGFYLTVLRPGADAVEDRIKDTVRHVRESPEPGPPGGFPTGFPSGLPTGPPDDWPSDMPPPPPLP